MLSQWGLDKNKEEGRVRPFREQFLVQVLAVKPQEESLSKSLALAVLNEFNENNSKVIMYVKLWA